MTETPTPVPSRRGKARPALLAVVYGAALGAGYLVGSGGLPPWPSSSSSSSPAETALARTRVGWVLRQSAVQAPPAAWAALAADVATVPDGWPSAVRKNFELLATVRGLTTGGQPDWSAAETLCRALKWSRCDRVALEQLRSRGRP